MFEIMDFIERKSGLSKEAIKEENLRRAISKRMRELGISNIKQYRNRFFNDEKEALYLMEGLLNHESFFFREPEHFELLKEEVNTMEKPIKVLSAGCARGEEPYSIAITLTETLGDYGWEVWGIDLSMKALKYAKSGVYTKGALRALDRSRITKYFERFGRGFRIKDRYRKNVKFFRANILECSNSIQMKFDVIFLRNVLIYFSKQARKAAIGKLSVLLEPGGLLLLGAMENLQDLDIPFEKRRFKMLFYYKNTAQIYTTKNYYQCKNSHIKRQDHSDEKVEHLKEIAYDFYERGIFDRFRETTKELTQIAPLDPEAHFLLAISYQKSDKPLKAEKEFRKAIFLDKHFSLAYLELGILYEARGKRKRATEMFKRALNTLDHNMHRKRKLFSKLKVNPNLIKDFLHGKLYVENSVT